MRNDDKVLKQFRLCDYGELFFSLFIFLFLSIENFYIECAVCMVVFFSVQKFAIIVGLVFSSHNADDMRKQFTLDAAELHSQLLVYLAYMRLDSRITRELARNCL